VNPTDRSIWFAYYRRHKTAIGFAALT